MSKLKTIAGILSERWREPSVCEACGNEFICGASLKGCWCSEIKLTDDTRAELRKEYSRCLCRECLVSRSQDSQSNTCITDAQEKEQVP